MKVLVAGPHGGKNYGDELIFSQVCSTIAQAGHEVIALNDDPDYTRRTHGVNVAATLDLRRLKLSGLEALKQVDAVVLAGGEQIQEGRWGNPLWGMLPTAAWIINRATAAGVPTMLWALGVSGIRTPLGRWFVRHAVAKATAITLRDVPSLERLVSLGVARDKVTLTADPVFELPRLCRPEARSLLDGVIGKSSRPTILLSPCNDGQGSSAHVRAIVEGCRAAARTTGARILVNVMDQRDKYDRGLLALPELAEDEMLRHYPDRPFCARELVALHAAADVVVSTRMHPLILAATQGTPWVNIARAPKMVAFAQEFDSPWLDQGAVTSSAVCDAVMQAIATDRETWAAAIARPLDTLSQRAEISRRVFVRELIEPLG